MPCLPPRRHYIDRCIKFTLELEHTDDNTRRVNCQTKMYRKENYEFRLLNTPSPHEKNET